MQLYPLYRKASYPSHNHTESTGRNITFYTLIFLRSVSISQINLRRRFHFSFALLILGLQGVNTSVYFLHHLAGYIQHTAPWTRTGWKRDAVISSYLSLWFWRWADIRFNKYSFKREAKYFLQSFSFWLEERKKRKKSEIFLISRVALLKKRNGMAVPGLKYQTDILDHYVKTFLSHVWQQIPCQNSTPVPWQCLSGK